MSLLEDAIKESRTSNLWKQYAKKFPNMQFKEYATESKVMFGMSGTNLMVSKLILTLLYTNLMNILDLPSNIVALINLAKHFSPKTTSYEHALILHLNLFVQFVRQKFTDLHYFFVPLLCLQCLFYASQMVILPRTRISTHVCFIASIFVVLVLVMISIADKFSVS